MILSFRSATVLCALSLLIAPLAGQAKTTKLRTAASAAFRAQDWGTAESAYAKLVAIDDSDGQSWYQLGYARHAQKKLDSALKAHMKAAASTGFAEANRLGAYNAACVFAMQNKADKAFEWLDKSVAAGYTAAGQISQDADLKNLHGDPRFGKLITRLKKMAADSPYRAFGGSFERAAARLGYFRANGDGAHIHVGYSPVEWKKAYNGVLEDESFVGTRWRFGAHFWTSLDTNVPLTIAGEYVEPGQYYLTLVHQGDELMAMYLLDPAEIRKHQLTSAQAGETRGGIEILFEHDRMEAVEKKLNIAMTPGARKTAKFVVRFGPHRLTAPMEVHLK